MLLGNGSIFHKSPLKFTGGAVGSLQQGTPSNFQKSGFSRNIIYISDRVTVSRYWSVPSYNNAGVAWLIPQSPGEIGSHEDAKLSFAATGNLVGGITSPGTAAFSFQTNIVDGQLIASGAGSASFSFSIADVLITSAASAAGTAAISFSAANATLGAIVSGAASATMTFSGSLVAYGVGNMTGSTVDSGVLTTSAIASEVWNTVAAAYNTSGSMGQKLNNAASGGVDYADLANAVWLHADALNLNTLMLETWGRLGLDIAAPLVTGSTEISFGSIVLAMTEAAGEVTLTRQ